jgi:hypothetical protein
MHVDLHRPGLFQQQVGAFHLCRGAMCHDEEVIALQCFLVLDDAALGDADAVERRAQGGPAHR